ncbi:hypothetical protein R3P38DRAFT_2849018 [Favolaschia claudopus]|uniref:Uncharacterized protein n=1 Tax=Favolaschia claudopus TaxID=2862362 RepID=A0AAW0DVS1_9AGAR
MAVWINVLHYLFFACFASTASASVVVFPHHHRVLSRTASIVLIVVVVFLVVLLVACRIAILRRRRATLPPISLLNTQNLPPNGIYPQSPPPRSEHWQHPNLQPQYQLSPTPPHPYNHNPQQYRNDFNPGSVGAEGKNPMRNPIVRSLHWQQHDNYPPPSGPPDGHYNPPSGPPPQSAYAPLAPIPPAYTNITGQGYSGYKTQ